MNLAPGYSLVPCRRCAVGIIYLSTNAAPPYHYQCGQIMDRAVLSLGNNFAVAGAMQTMFRMGMAWLWSRWEPNANGKPMPGWKVKR